MLLYNNELKITHSEIIHKKGLPADNPLKITLLKNVFHNIYSSDFPLGNN
jgi:hypothetical protein